MLRMIEGKFVGISVGLEVTGMGVGASVSFMQSLDLLSYSQFGAILHASLSRLGHSRLSGLSHNPLPSGKTTQVHPSVFLHRSWLRDRRKQLIWVPLLPSSVLETLARSVGVLVGGEEGWAVGSSLGIDAQS